MITSVFQHIRTKGEKVYKIRANMIMQHRVHWIIEVSVNIVWPLIAYRIARAIAVCRPIREIYVIHWVFRFIQNHSSLRTSYISTHELTNISTLFANKGDGIQVTYSPWLDIGQSQNFPFPSFIKSVLCVMWHVPRIFVESDLASTELPIIGH
jgi:hypothetical protein